MELFNIPGAETRARQLPVIVNLTSAEVGILRIVAMKRLKQLEKVIYSFDTEVIALNNALDTLTDMGGGVARFSGRQAGELMMALALDHNFIGGADMYSYLTVYQKIKAAR